MSKLGISLQFLFLISCFISSEAWYKCRKPILDLTVTPETFLIRVHWDLEKELYKEGDWIGVYHGETDTNDCSKNLRQSVDISASKGHKDTNEKYSETTIIDYSKSHIMNWRAIYWRKHSDGRDEALVTAKIITAPNWMENYWNLLRDKPLNQIFIPGSRKASSYVSYDAAESTDVSPHKIKQRVNVERQLLAGIRYLDMRVIKVNGEYWNDIKTVKMDTILHDVAKFADKTNKELIILDFYRLQDDDDGHFSDDDEDDFVKYLKHKLKAGDTKLWICPEGKSWTSSLDDLVNGQEQVLVSFANKHHDAVTRHRDILWGEIKHIYAKENGKATGKEKLHELVHDYLHERPEDKCYVSSVNFARHLREDIYNFYYKEDLGLKTNILASDFAVSSGIIKKAFLWNTRKFQEDGTKKGCDGRSSYNDQYYQHNIIEYESE